ncbi:MAG: amidohydrolase family protein [Chloroflexota bacterium]|nr:MAG: amidohydrolase family protein [Chloroflexota bacterium]
MKWLMLFIPLFLLIACARAPEGTVPEEADPGRLAIYHNGTILTMADDPPVAEAIAIRGEFIEEVGSNEEILALGEEASTVTDLGGRVLMPGFVDAHTHLLNDHRSQGQSLDEAQYEALKNGITTLGTLYVDRGFLREIQKFDEAGFLRVRTGLYLVATDPCGDEQGDWWKEHPPTDVPGEMLRVNGVKIFTDGGSCGKVALSFELESGSGMGDLWFTQDELNEMVAEVDAAGYQAAVHAIGDRAVTQALNALESVLDGQPNALRHRMEHVSVIPPEAIPRFGELGIVPVLIGEFPNCTPYGPPVPEEFGHMEWPWRALRAANPDLPIAWHSDVPFQSIDPFDHVLGFVTRIDTMGRAICRPAEWLKQHTITVEEALSIMTIQSAYALSRDDEVGSLSPGKYADFIVLEKDPFEAEAEELAENRVLLTVAGGRTEYCRPTDHGLCPGFINREPVPLPDHRPPVIVRWLAALLVVVIPVGAMLLRKRRAPLVRRVGGWAGIASGAILLVTLFLSESADDSAFIVLLLLFFPIALGVAGLAALWRGGIFGTFALWTSLLGAVAVALGGIMSEWFDNESAWQLFILGGPAYAIGLSLFGLANLKGRVLTRLNALPLAVGLLGGIAPVVLGFLLPESSDFPWQMILGVMGGGWLLLGVLLLRSQTVEEKSALEPSQPEEELVK